MGGDYCWSLLAPSADTPWRKCLRVHAVGTLRFPAICIYLCTSLVTGYGTEISLFTPLTPALARSDGPKALGAHETTKLYGRLLSLPYRPNGTTLKHKWRTLKWWARQNMQGLGLPRPKYSPLQHGIGCEMKSTITSAGYWHASIRSLFSWVSP